MNYTLRALLLAATATFAYSALPALAAEEAAPAAEAAAPAAKPAASTKDFTIIKLGTEEVKNSDVLETWKGLFPGGSAPDFNSFDENIRQNVLRGLVSERLIYNEAVKSGYDKDAEVKKRIAAVEKQVVMQAFMENKAKDLVTDEQLRAAYAEKVASVKGMEEVKARHILLESEDEAKKLSAQIKKGGDFEKLAKEKSTDKGSGANGGELGWFTKEKMVPEFADAAYKLKKGEVSEPVKSEFGWHIIQVEDRRPMQVASFEDMKESLRGGLANKAVQGYVEALLKKADIKYYGADGKEKPFSTSLTPPAGKGADDDKKEEKIKFHGLIQSKGYNS
jgi:peptidyl-prolyl cis-trans isomerase C